MSSTGFTPFPVIITQKQVNTYAEADLLAGAKVSHPRGHILFKVTDDSTGFIWSLEVEGTCPSYASLSAINYIVFTQSYVGISSLTPVSANLFTIVTNAADSGGRTYNLLFQPNFNDPAILTKTAGAALATTASVSTDSNQLHW
jgi:hypothetical protein